MQNTISFIQAMEDSKGLRAGIGYSSHNAFNFKAANEMIQKLGGNLEMVLSTPDKEEFQNIANINLYIHALLLRRIELMGGQ